MKKNSLYYLAIIALLYVIGAVFNGQAIYNQSKRYTGNKQDYVDVLNFQDRLLSVEEWVYTGSGWKERDLASKEKLKSSEMDYAVEKKYSYWFIAGSTAFIIIVLVIYWGAANLHKALGLAVIAIALACLVIGVMIPMLEISAYSTNLTIPLRFSVPLIGEIDIPDKVFEGRMYYYYQSKSVIDLINVLFESKNYVVAISIFGFSVLIPFIKLTLSVLLLLSRPFSDSGLVKKTVGRIGKWSMADVFVVATFLSYLSFSNINTEIDTEADTLVGLYFFFAYCILSIVSSQFIDLTVKKDR
ncbi:MAG: paraquat-inducible protein A [Candidatus Scalindua rubra]|uniref:Paraquat-inducible protein A n=1 Tax=Candidatus Scalindua brodae TaxID=237368 RepID=A0A0B0EJ50_9BACT|nr:MAG: Paraquat-inducible protein A [Candidatus Scalindua brodae]MBZ0108500.1 paraquat-inducible protein A [Candidatus Scalindua rubra]TWU36355.1 Paraquat-inducible protein A [Candidatus Brocadiaceae bacterium S225]